MSTPPQYALVLSKMPLSGFLQLDHNTCGQHKEGTALASSQAMLSVNVRCENLVTYILIHPYFLPVAIVPWLLAAAIGYPLGNGHLHPYESIWGCGVGGMVK